ncbi:MAG: S66 peptidase family protein, partial [Thermoanaerobaculia bacterium]
MTPSASLIRPAPLYRGGSIAVLAASSPSRAHRIEEARSRLERGGNRVEIAANAYFTHNHYLAGSDSERLRELNQYLRDPRFDAFFFSRGGYGAMRILDAIDYGAIRELPRPIIGYSDVTALHQAIATRAGVVSFHGPMMNTDFYEGLSPERDAWFWSMLEGEAPLEYSFGPADVVAQGTTEGLLFGGCLSLTVALIGTPYDFWIDDGIWFFEDIGEPAYRIDRMLTHLRLSGRLRSIRGVMIGRLKECGSEDGADVNRLLHEFFGDAS